MIENIIKQFEESISDAEKNGDDLNDVSWSYQNGILINCNEAKEIIQELMISKTTHQSILPYGFKIDILQNDAIQDGNPKLMCSKNDFKMIEASYKNKSGVEYLGDGSDLRASKQ